MSAMLNTNKQIALLSKIRNLKDMQICRICLQQGSVRIRIPMFTSVNPYLKLFCDIDVKTNDGYPQHLCGTCFSTLNAAILLRKTAKKSQALLEYQWPNICGRNNKSKSVEEKQNIRCETSNMLLQQSEAANSEQIKPEIFETSSPHRSEHYLENEDYEDAGEICSYEAEDSTAADVHVKMFNDPTVLNTSGQVHNIAEDASKYKCHLCPKAYQQRKNLILHLRKNHKGNLQIKCSQCPYVGPPASDRHARLHREYLKNKRKLFKCHLCPKLFLLRDSLKSHIHKHEDPTYNHTEPTDLKSEPKVYICEVCGRKCTFLSSLNNHRRTHTDNFQFKCEKCPYKGRTKNNLIHHSRIHGDAKHKCHVCQKVFKFKSGLNFHVRRHGEPTLSCDQCDRKFYEKSYLNIHIKKDHQHVDTSVTCQTCGDTFVNRRYLLDHEVKKHNRKKKSGGRALYLQLGKQDNGNDDETS